MTREDFNEFSGAMDMKSQKVTTQFLLLERRAWEQERLKDAKIQDLERHVQSLQAALRRAQDPSDMQRGEGRLLEQQNHIHEEATTALGRELREAQMLYDDLPSQLRQITVDLVLSRAEVAKALRDWVTMEDHSAYAANLAETLNDGALSARCEFCRGIAFLGQGRWALAHQAFENAVLCVGVYVTVEEFNEWHQRLMKAVNESPSRSNYGASAKSTPIDQTLFQGFESIQNIYSEIETPENITHLSPIVPVIRQPLPRAGLESQSGTRQRLTYVPQRPQNTFKSPVFQTSFRHAHQTWQGSRNRPYNDGDFPQLGSLGTQLSSDKISPLNQSRRPAFAGNLPFISGEDAGGETRLPSIYRGIPNGPRRSSKLSVHFVSESEPSEPLTNPEPPQELVHATKRFLLSSTSSSEPPQELVHATKRFLLSSTTSSDRLIVSPTPPKTLVQPAKRFALSSDSSSGRIIPLFGGRKNPGPVVYPPPPQQTPSSGTSYAGSSNISPQTRPPDLDDNRREFPILTVFKPTPKLNQSGSFSTTSGSGPLDRPERSVTPLTEEALALLMQETRTISRSMSAQKSGYGILGRPPGELLNMQEAVQETLLDLLVPPGEMRDDDAVTEEAATTREDQENGFSAIKQDASILPSSEAVGYPLQNIKQRERTPRKEQEEPFDAQDRLLNVQLRPTLHIITNNSHTKLSSTSSSIPLARATLEEIFDETFGPFPSPGGKKLKKSNGETANVKVEADKKENGAGHEDQPESGDITENLMNGSSNKSEKKKEEPQPPHPIKYGIKRSRNDPDFDSLYDLSSIGSTY